MEKSTPIGLAAGIVLIYGAIFIGEGWQTFFDIASLLLVVGGTMAGLLVSYTFDEIKQVIPATKAFFSFQPPDLHGYLIQFSELSRTARSEGLLALDRRLEEIDDTFMRFGLEMAVDGIAEESVDSLMMKRLHEEMRNRQLAAKFFTNAGTYAPAFGMIGTLIGLIQMLQNLTDPAQIGAGMSVAMITTFYGALLANLVFLPMSVKMRTQQSEVLKAREMVREGIQAIMRGDGPSMVEKRLRLFVDNDPPKEAGENDNAALSRAA